MEWETLNAETLEYPANVLVETTQEGYDADLTSWKETEDLSSFSKDERKECVTIERDLLWLSVVE